ncbi:hypothetical protein COY27_00885 [Candidatus Woesearchaeota archaeon CG_4_10_14_0_2_um_filter_33_13]|nr:MAG: hypothetical protein COY27_00885 [Candidatus Woesearchaeota archaeon CG_4_10_14_0_2_um_filter_33_13]
MVKKQIKHKAKKHPLDETMVIIVLVSAALCILIMLASYINVTGEAYASAVPTKEGVFSQINGALSLQGSGKAICSIQCKNSGQICILAHNNDKLAGCEDKLTGDYQCLCATTVKVISTPPSVAPPPN